MTTQARRAGRDVDWPLYLVTDPMLAGAPSRVPDVVYEAVLGGVRVVQFRDKDAGDAEFTARARDVVAAVAQASADTGLQVPLFVNDRLPVARDLGLHLHVGQGDVPFARARGELPDELMVGLSIENDAQLEAVLRSPGPAPDVVGISPVWATPTKTDTAPGLGLAGAARLARVAREASVPTVGIGGITVSTIADVASTDLDGACVVSAIMASADPRRAAATLREAWEQAR